MSEAYFTCLHLGVTNCFHSFFHSIESEKWFKKNSLPSLQKSSIPTQYSTFPLAVGGRPDGYGVSRVSGHVPIVASRSFKERDPLQLLCKPSGITRFVQRTWPIHFCGTVSSLLLVGYSINRIVS